MRLSRLFLSFFHSEKSSGILLIVTAIVSMLLANSSLSDTYISFWHHSLAGQPIEFWVNDVLMTVFFFLIGLEIEREVYIGELSNIRKAMLPVFAAIGGMLLPAGIHLIFSHGSIYQRGAGIPMATDIAFSLGILSLLGSRVPANLKIFLTALAIIDDLGAIIIIALFYSSGIEWFYLAGAAAVFAAMLFLNRLKVYRVWIYLILGAVLWVLLHQSGIHATIAGVLTAFALPFGNGDEKSPSYAIQRRLHLPVAYFIVPLFALANTAIALPENLMEGIKNANTLGIFFGLIAGKPVGILLFSVLAITTGIAARPEGVTRKQLFGAGILAGIGFTMSIFITLLAFDDPEIVIHSKLAICCASIAAGLAGFIWLKLTTPESNLSTDES